MHSPRPGGIPWLVTGGRWFVHAVRVYRPYLRQWRHEGRAATVVAGVLSVYTEIWSTSMSYSPSARDRTMYRGCPR